MDGTDITAAGRAEVAILRRLRGAGSWLLLAAALSIPAIMLLPAAFGYQRYVITGGSMTGAIDRGSIVFDKAVPVRELRVGDVVTYRPPPGSGPAGLVTHRIVWAGHDRTGALAFRTKGDFNAVRDPWLFTLHRPVQARVAFHVPYVGYLLAALAIPKLRMLLIGLPALVFGIAAAVRLWREEDEPLAVAEAV